MFALHRGIEEFSHTFYSILRFVVVVVVVVVGGGGGGGGSGGGGGGGVAILNELAEP